MSFNIDIAIDQVKSLVDTTKFFSEELKDSVQLPEVGILFVAITDPAGNTKTGAAIFPLVIADSELNIKNPESITDTGVQNLIKQTLTLSKDLDPVSDDHAKAGESVVGCKFVYSDDIDKARETLSNAVAATKKPV